MPIRRGSVGKHEQNDRFQFAVAVGHEAGKIAERGTHDELMARNDRYAALHNIVPE